MAEYIDRAAIYEKLNNLPHEYRNAEQRARTGGIAACKEIVRYFPAADVVEVVHASWVWNPDGMDWGIGAWVCGKCGSRPETWWNTVKECHPLRCSGSRYCGNCGADMRGET